MMDREKCLKITAQYATSFKSNSLEQLRDFNPDDPETVHDPRCPIKISNTVIITVFIDSQTYVPFPVDKSVGFSSSIIKLFW